MYHKNQAIECHLIVMPLLNEIITIANKITIKDCEIHKVSDRNDAERWKYTRQQQQSTERRATEKSG